MGGETKKGERARWSKQQRRATRAGRAIIEHGFDSMGTPLEMADVAHDDLAYLGEQLGQRGDGWVRIVPHVDGSFSWKFRFTHGKHAGRYVFVVQPAEMKMGEALDALLGQLDEVDSGLRKPSPDVYR